MVIRKTIILAHSFANSCSKLNKSYYIELIVKQHVMTGTFKEELFIPQSVLRNRKRAWVLQST